MNLGTGELEPLFGFLGVVVVVAAAAAADDV